MSEPHPLAFIVLPALRKDNSKRTGRWVDDQEVTERADLIKAIDTFADFVYDRSLDGVGVAEPIRTQQITRLAFTDGRTVHTLLPPHAIRRVLAFYYPVLMPSV